MAGYIDGEGYFSFGRSPVLGISNTHLPTLQELCDEFGGSIRAKHGKKKAHRPGFEWRVYGNNAKQVIREVLPFLREKQAQAELLLALPYVPPAHREPLKQQLKQLKRPEYSL